MPAPGKREITDTEREAFIAANKFGVLCFAGTKPYAVPVAYKYFKGAIIFMMQRAGRKLGYIEKNKNVCFNIWQMGDQCAVPGLRELRYISVLLEGNLEEIPHPEWAKYELPPPRPTSVAFKLNAKAVGTTAALQPPK